MQKIFFAVLLFALFSSTVFASDSEITFNGNITLNGRKINGSAKVSLPETNEFTTQDDSSMVMAMLFKREGYDKAKPDFTIKTSEPFTVSGSLINGVYRLQRTSKNGSLNSIGGDQAPCKIPARPGDYYIGINALLDNEDEEEIDAAILHYIKISVVNDSFSETDTKFPALGICTGSNVRLRNAPGTDSKVTGRANESDRLIILGAEILDGELWLIIDNPSGKGRAYITGRYVEVIDNESPVHKALINMRRTFGTTPAKTKILLGRPLKTLKGSDDGTYDSKFIYKGCEVDYINDRTVNIDITQRGWSFGGVQVGDSLQKVHNTMGKPYSSYENEDGLIHEYELYPDHIQVTFRKNLVTHIEWRMFGDPADHE